MRRVLFGACLALAVQAAGGEELRTLFHTAEEREQMDRLRRGDPPEESPAKRGPPVVGGYVKRSDGRNTVWLDGQPVTGPEAQRLAEPSKLRDPGQGNRSIEIKPSR
jgi:hypothetical protein